MNAARHAVTREEAEDRLDAIVERLRTTLHAATIRGLWLDDWVAAIDDLHDLIRDLTPSS